MKRILSIFILFYFASVLFAQSLPNTILWKVTKPGSKNESFLFGTFHEVNPSFLQLLPNTMSKLEQSDILFVEERIGVSDKSGLKDQPQWGSVKWNTMLTNEQKQIFSDFVKKADDTSYYKLNPLILSLTTSRLYLANFCETDTAIAELMDHYIEKLAIRQNKRIYSLDLNQNMLLKNAAENPGLLQDSTYASYGIHFMKSMLNNDLSSCEIISAYKRFDINYQFDTDLTPISPNASLLIERNKAWIQKLHQVLPSNNCFIAVGFRHLFYRQGLIEQLKKLGYSVMPMPAGQ